MAVEDRTRTRRNELLKDARVVARRQLEVKANSTASSRPYPVAANGGGHANGVAALDQQVKRVLAQLLPGPDTARALGRFAPLPVEEPIAPPMASAAEGGLLTLYSRTGAGGATAPRDAAAPGTIGLLPPKQAALHRKFGLATADALRVLDGIPELAVTDDLDQLRALQAVVRAEFQGLEEEAGRLEGLRRPRIDALFAALLGETDEGAGHLAQLREAAVSAATADVRTVLGETREANFDLLEHHAETMRAYWEGHKQSAGAGGGESFGQRLATADTLLPIVAETGAGLLAAMDAIGFSAEERRSAAGEFDTDETLGSTPGQYVRLKVADLLEWVEGLTTVEGAAMLSASGQYGLEYVTGQADRLHRLLASLLLAEGEPSMLGQVMADKTVNRAAKDLLFQIDTLADQAV